MRPGSESLKTQVQRQLAETKDRAATRFANVINQVSRHYEAIDFARRGVCFLNVGDFQKAKDSFQQSLARGNTQASIAGYLATALVELNRPEEAASHLAGKLYSSHDEDSVTRIRHALALWSAGKTEDAIRSLREGIRRNAECAEYHFQLGTLLASLERYDEAELRFTQAVNIDRGHANGLVSLAMCCGIRNAPGEALSCLQRAQEARPHDASIALLLAQAASATQREGITTRVRAAMPEDSTTHDDEGVEELSRVIASDPDFVEAFLQTPEGELNDQVFHMLQKSLRKAIEASPRNAHLHWLCGLVLGRLGDDSHAIIENERAVQIDPKCVNALIELGKLYQKTDRHADATTRLEQAILAGADYADVYYHLGNVYRAQGFTSRAKSAYRHALHLNKHYEAALDALEMLTVG